MKRVAPHALRVRLYRSSSTSFKLARTLAALLVAASPLALPQAHAASATGNVTVSATVAQKCIVSASAVGFGAYDPVVTNASTALTATGSLAVTCTKSSTSITIGLGLGANADGSTRRMVAGGTNYLTYELYHPSATTANAACSFPGTTVWGTAGPNLFTPTGTTWGAAAAQTFNVCGSVAGGQDVPAGSYSDTIVATITF